jgi:putative hemolysin
VNDVLGSIVLVLALILIGGFFAASEIALVSLRDAQVQRLAADGKRGRRLARLHGDPNRFLAAVQVGVTLAGFLSAAVGGSALADSFAPALVDLGLSQAAATAVAIVCITVVISYLSLVLGELVPKRLALQRAESVSLAVASTIDRIATLFRPVIWFLSISTNALVRLLGGDPTAGREEISQEEVRGLLASHTGLSAEEREIVSEVFIAGETRLREVMVPRTEVAFLDADDAVSAVVAAIAEQPHSRYPVIGNGVDDVVGFVHVRDLLDPEVSGRRVPVGDLARPVMQLPASKQILPAMSAMRRARAHLAIVVDEYGGTAGIVTLEDLVEEIIGDIRDEYDDSAATTTALEGGAVEVDGLLSVEDFADETGVRLPDGPYETAAGFVTSGLGRLAVLGDHVDVHDQRIEVIAMDGRRIDRLRVSTVPAEPATPQP